MTDRKAVQGICDPDSTNLTTVVSYRWPAVCTYHIASTTVNFMLQTNKENMDRYNISSHNMVII